MEKHLIEPLLAAVEQGGTDSSAVVRALKGFG
jgi:hypothetical protein